MKIKTILKNSDGVLTIANNFFLHNKGIKRVVWTKSIFKKSIFEVSGRNNKVIIEEGCLLTGCRFRIFGDNNVFLLGKKSRLDETFINVEGANNSIKIGNHFLNKGAEISALEGTNIFIGDDCMFSTNVLIMTSDAHSIFDIKTTQRINKSGNVMIGNRVWIGTKALLLKGVEIGDDSVVGAGSVLTHNHFGHNVIIAGNPGKVVRDNVSWDRRLL